MRWDTSNRISHSRWDISVTFSTVPRAYYVCLALSSFHPLHIVPVTVVTFHFCFLFPCLESLETTHLLSDSGFTDFVYFVEMESYNLCLLCLSCSTLLGSEPYSIYHYHFWWLHNIPLNGCTTFCLLSLHWSIDTWVVSTYWILWLVLCCVGLCPPVYFSVSNSLE